METGTAGSTRVGNGEKPNFLTILEKLVEKALAEASTPAEPVRWEGGLLEVRLVVAGELRPDSQSHTVNMTGELPPHPNLKNVREKLKDRQNVLDGAKVLENVLKDFLFTSSNGSRIAQGDEENVEVRKIAMKDENSDLWVLNMEKDYISSVMHTPLAMENQWRLLDGGAKFLERWEAQLNRNRVLCAFLPGDKPQQAGEAFATWIPDVIPTMLPFTDSSIRVTTAHDARTVAFARAGVFSGQADFAVPLLGSVGAGVTHSRSVSQSMSTETVQIVGITDYPRMLVRMEPHIDPHGKRAVLLEPSMHFVEAMLEVFDALLEDKKAREDKKVEPYKTKIRNAQDKVALKSAIDEACRFMHREAHEMVIDIQLSKGENITKLRKVTGALQTVMKRFGLKYDFEFHLGGKILSETHVSKSQWIEDKSIENEFKATIAAAVGGKGNVSASIKSTTKEEKIKGLDIKFSSAVGGDALKWRDTRAWIESLKEPHNWAVTLRPKQNYVWEILQMDPDIINPSISELCQYLIKHIYVIATVDSLSAFVSVKDLKPSVVTLEEMMFVCNLHWEAVAKYYEDGLVRLDDGKVEAMEFLWKEFHRVVKGRWRHAAWRALVTRFQVEDADKRERARLIKQLSSSLSNVARQWIFLTVDEKALMESLWRQFYVELVLKKLKRAGPLSPRPNVIPDRPKPGDPKALIKQCLDKMQNKADDASVQEKGCESLAKLIQSETQDGQRIVDAEGIQVVLNAMKNHDSVLGVQMKGYEVLYELARNHTGLVTGEIVKALASVALKGDFWDDHIDVTGAIKAIVNAMKAHQDDSDMQENGCRALRNIALSNIVYCYFVGEAGGAEAIIASLQSCERSADVCEQAIGALADLTWSNSGNRVSIRKAGGIVAVLSAMLFKRRHDKVQEEGCRALRSFALDNNENCDTLCRFKMSSFRSGVAVVVRAMKDHASSPNVQEQGCAALANVALSNGANRASVDEYGGIPVILDAIKRHATEKGVQSQGRLALQHLAKSEEIKNKIIALEPPSDWLETQEESGSMPERAAASISTRTAEGGGRSAPQAAATHRAAPRGDNGAGVATGDGPPERLPMEVEEHRMGAPQPVPETAFPSAASEAEAGETAPRADESAEEATHVPAVPERSEQETEGLGSEDRRRRAPEADVPRTASKAIAEGIAPTEADNGAGALAGNGRETAGRGPEDVEVVTTTHTAADVPLVLSSSTPSRVTASAADGTAPRADGRAGEATQGPTVPEEAEGKGEGEGPGLEDRRKRTRRAGSGIAAPEVNVPPSSAESAAPILSPQEIAKEQKKPNAWRKLRSVVNLLKPKAASPGASGRKGPEDVVVEPTTHTASEAPLDVSSSTTSPGTASASGTAPRTDEVAGGGTHVPPAGPSQ
mmetsp:Transcript_26527/g.43413  ORF Transcript_26527/g.43413 Transcript_26527/m.43413 type:complete len:1392 (+) Transcript_26527:305-4480(+)